MSEKEKIESEISEMDNREYPDVKIFIDCFEGCNKKVNKWIISSITSIYNNISNNITRKIRKPRIKSFKEGTKIKIRETVLFDIGSQLSLYLEINFFVLDELSKEFEQEKSWTYLYYNTPDKMPDPINNLADMQILIEKERSKLRKNGCEFHLMPDIKNDHLKKPNTTFSSTQQLKISIVKYFWDIHFAFIY